MIVIFRRFRKTRKRLLAPSCLTVSQSVLPSVRPSVRLHRITRLPLDGYSWNIIFEYFSKICLEYSRFIKIEQE